LDGLSEEIDPLGVWQWSTCGIFNLMNEIKSLAQHVGRGLTQDRQRKGETGAENDEIRAKECRFH
jgi:hypothetical protein